MSMRIIRSTCFDFSIQKCTDDHSLNWKYLYIFSVCLRSSPFCRCHKASVWLVNEYEQMFMVDESDPAKLCCQIAESNKVISVYFSVDALELVRSSMTDDFLEKRSLNENQPSKIRSTFTLTHSFTKNSYRHVYTCMHACMYVYEYSVESNVRYGRRVFSYTH